MPGNIPEAQLSINNRPEFTYFPVVSEIPLSGKTAVTWMLNSALVGNDKILPIQYNPLVFKNSALK